MGYAGARKCSLIFGTGFGTLERRGFGCAVSVPKIEFRSNPFQRFWNGEKAENPLYYIYLYIKKSLRSKIPNMLLNLNVCVLEALFGRV